MRVRIGARRAPTMNRFSFQRPSRTRTAQPVAEVLGRTDAFAALRAGVEQIAALERDLRQLLPDYLATGIEPGFIKDGTLALFAAHSALAARLRHLEPRHRIGGERVSGGTSLGAGRRKCSPSLGGCDGPPDRPAS